MSNFPNSPGLLKGGIVLINPDTAAVRFILVQYDPEKLTRMFSSQVMKGGAP